MQTVSYFIRKTNDPAEAGENGRNRKQKTKKNYRPFVGDIQGWCVDGR